MGIETKPKGLNTFIGDFKVSSRLNRLHLPLLLGIKNSTVKVQTFVPDTNVGSKLINPYILGKSRKEKPRHSRVKLVYKICHYH